MTAEATEAMSTLEGALEAMFLGHLLKIMLY